MKKLFAVMMAAATIAMVGCKKDEGGSPDIKKTTPDVEAMEGYFTIAWNAYGYTDCEPLVFAGNYNDYVTENVEDLIKFEKIEGYENWYVARISFDENYPDKDGNTSCQGKGCALYDGAFDGSWSHQWYDKGDELKIEIIQGDAEFVMENDEEKKLVIAEPGSVVYVRSYRFKEDPCAEVVKYDVTFNLEVKNPIAAEDEVTLIGDFPEKSWKTGEEAYVMTRVDDTHFTFEIQNVAVGKHYKYAINGSWDHEMYLVAPAEGDTCVAKSEDGFSISFNVINDVVEGFLGITTGEEIKGFCPKEGEEPAPAPVDVEVHAGDVLTITATVAEELNLTEGLFLYSWGHEGDACLPMTESGDHEWTVSYTVTEGDVAGWKETGMLFVDVMINGDADWARKGGQTGDLKPMRSGNFQIAADWKVTEVTDEPAEEGGEEA